MADVTGPISSLPGAWHRVPRGTMCDLHADKLAVARVQGETDSFGSELNDMCQTCYDEYRAAINSPEAQADKIGVCEWCKCNATDLRDARDYDEGMCGRVYRVCGACIIKRNDAAAEELAQEKWEYDDY
jgi:hypothetical protein